MKLETVLDKVTDICREYSAMQTLDGHRLNELLKDLTGRLYYLETIRSRTHDLWQKEVFELTQEGMTVSRAECQAHVKHPQMYLLSYSGICIRWSFFWALPIS